MVIVTIAAMALAGTAMAVASATLGARKPLSTTATYNATDTCIARIDDEAFRMPLNSSESNVLGSPPPKDVTAPKPR